jgi:hypothetical protein
MTGFSGGSSIALGAVTTGTGRTGSGNTFKGRTGAGCGTLMRLSSRVGGFSCTKVIGARYCTAERTVCTTGADCSANHSNARCSTAVSSSDGIDMR